ncbi:MAG: hypothetical protein R3B47_10120 [Bacteroidia bacterium]
MSTATPSFAGYIGKTLIGQRVEDIMKALDVVSNHPDVDTKDRDSAGIDRAGFRR